MHNLVRVRPRRGFTLIELLVVVAVVGVLVSVALPALGAARDSAMRAKNLASLRDLGIIALAVVAESDGVMPRSTHSYFAHADEGALPWYRVVAREAIGAEVGPGDPSFHAYVDDALRSPFDPRSSGDSDSPFAPEYNGSYGFNVYFELTASETPDARTWRRVTSIRRTSATVVFGELDDQGGTHLGRDHVVAHFLLVFAVEPRRETAMVRQRPGSGAAFADGHASIGPFEELYSPEGEVDRWNPATAR